MAGMLRERKAAFAHTSSRLNIIGTMLCILSVVPIFVSVCFENADFAPAAAVSLTLVIAGIGSAAFVLGEHIILPLTNFLKRATTPV